ncbi:MAG: hypothetical protein VW551_05830 [Euryarchaeota archaeon]|jgi:hypothetical protein
MKNKPLESNCDSSKPFLDGKENAEDTFWRLKKASDKRRQDRVKRILAQEDEKIFLTLYRMFFLSFCIIFNGIVLIQIPVSLGKSIGAWALYAMMLFFVIQFQSNLYKKWFEVDISQIEFETL